MLVDNALVSILLVASSLLAEELVEVIRVFDVAKAKATVLPSSGQRDRTEAEDATEETLREAHFIDSVVLERVDHLDEKGVIVLHHVGIESPAAARRLLVLGPCRHQDEDGERQAKQCKHDHASKTSTDGDDKRHHTNHPPDAYTHHV